MYYFTKRHKPIFIVYLFALIFYFLFNSIIARSSFKNFDANTYDIKKILTNIEQSSTLIIQKSLKVNPVSAAPVKGDNVSGKLLTLAPAINASVSSIAYIPAPIENFIPDKKKWEEQIRRSYKNGAIRTIIPGIKHIKLSKNLKSGHILINVVEVNPSLNSKISIEPALAGITLPNVRKISSIVKQNDALVGINASFFKPSNGVPLGTMIINQELITGPIFNRVTFGIQDNKFKMAKISLKGKLSTNNGNEIKIDNVNQPRMLSSYVLLYSYRWGKTAPSIPKYGLQVAVDNGKIIAVSKDKLAIPLSGYVIVGPEKELGRLKVNDQIHVSFSTDPDWSGIEHAVSGGPFLVKDGKVFVDAKDEKLGSINGLNPRTAIGYTRDNRLIMITIDGRQKASKGISLLNLANLMKEFGCYNAMNFDGGSSTQMFVQNKVVNYPLNKGGNYVSNGLIVKVKKQELMED